MAKPTQLKIALIIALSLAAASTAFATPTLFSGATSVGGTSFSSSNKVKVYAATDGTADQFDGSNYGIRAAHDSGDKIIAARSGDAKMYFATSTPNNATSFASSAATDTDLTQTGTWTSM